MGYKPLVNTEYEMDQDPGSSSHSPGSWDGFTKIELKSDKDYAEDNKLLHTSLAWVASGCSYPSYTFITGAGVITADSEKCFTDGVGVLKCIKEKCQGTCNGSFYQYIPPAKFDYYSCSCTFTFEKSGQSNETVQGK